MKLKSLLFFVVCCFVVPGIFAQTVNLQVNIVSVERTNYADCFGCGNPDPTWKITAVDNGAGAVLNGPYCIHFEDDNNTLAMGWNSAPLTTTNILFKPMAVPTVSALLRSCTTAKAKDCPAAAKPKMNSQIDKLI